jgi:PKD repeat protein
MLHCKSLCPPRYLMLIILLSLASISHISAIGNLAVKPEAILLDTCNFNLELGADTTICEGEVIEIGGDFAGADTLSFLWIPTGDTISSIVVDTTGEYILQVTSDSGCVALDTIQIEVQARFTASVVVEPLLYCEGDTFNLSIAGTVSDTASFSWQFWDGGALSDTTSEISYIVSDGSGDGFQPIFVFIEEGVCEEALDTAVLTGIEPMAAVGNIGAECFGIPVEFFNFSDTEPDALYHWDFGDGMTIDTISTSSIEYNYGENGALYDIILEVTNPNGCTDSDTTSYAVLMKPEINLDAIAGICSQDTLIIEVELADTSSATGFMGVDPTSEVLPVLIGDVPYVPMLTDTQSLVYTFVGMVMNENNCSDTDSVHTMIEVSPQADFIFVETCFGDSTTFIDESDFVLANATYEWDFGDGNGVSSEDQTPFKYFFEGNGQTYDVQLTINNPNGCTSEVEYEVTSRLQPTAVVSVDSVCLGEQVSINNDSENTNNNTSFTLIFGDGESEPINELVEVYSYAYDMDGLYAIELMVDNNNGCTDADTAVAEVFPLPVVAFFPIDANHCIGDPTVELSASPAGGVFSGLNVTDTTTDTDSTGFFDPITVGTNIKLSYSFTDDRGCTNLDTFIVNNVFPLPEVSFAGLDPAYCLGDEPDTIVANVDNGLFMGAEGLVVTTSDDSVVVFDPIIVEENVVLIYTYTDANGCTNFDEQQSIVHELPVADIVIEGSDSPSDTVGIVPGETLTLTNLLLDNDYVYQWSNNSDMDEITIF